MGGISVRNCVKGRTGNLSRIAVAAVFGWSTIYPALAQTPPPGPQGAQGYPQGGPPAVQPGAVPPAPQGQPLPPPQTGDQVQPAYSLSELEYLLGPVALYPDPLLAILFPATLFPEQLVEAYNWIIANPGPVQERNFTAVDAFNWDSSVKALVRFPDVIILFHEHMEWAESLGLAFSTQPQDVSNTIQMLRAKAQAVGNLQTTPQQVVTTQEVPTSSGGSGPARTIYIQPADPERIYVPAYDSSEVFTTFATGALAFGAGVLVGSYWNNNWGWNNRPWNSVWVVPPRWVRPP